MTKGALHGILAMLSGKGEKKSRQARRKFWDAIPDAPGFDPAAHPAARSNSNEAMSYRRANQMYGAKSKQEHRQFASLQAAKAEYDRQVATNPGGRVIPFWDWLDEQTG